MLIHAGISEWIIPSNYSPQPGGYPWKKSDVTAVPTANLMGVGNRTVYDDSMWIENGTVSKLVSGLGSTFSSGDK